MENLACGSSQIVRDEDYARKLQSEEFLPGRDSYISLTTRFNEYKLNSLKNYRRRPTANYELKENNDSVIIIDDESDESEPIESTRRKNYENSNQIRRSRTLHVSPSFESLNRSEKEKEERLKADEELAKRMQDEYDKELLTIRHEQDQIENEINPLQTRQASRHRGSLRPSHSESLQNAYAILQHRRTRNRPISEIPFHPSIEQDMFNLVARNISSNELRPNNPSTSVRHRIDIDRTDPQNSNQRLHHELNVDININSNPIYPSEPINIRRDMRPTHFESIIDRRFLDINNNRRRRMIRNSIQFNEFINNDRNFTNSYEQLLELDERNIKTKLSNQELDCLTSFPFKAIKDNVSPSDMSCSICFDDYEPRSNLTALVCSHKFHTNCVKKWLHQSRRCPLCQKDAINGT